MNYRTTDLMNELSNASNGDSFKNYINEHKDMTSFTNLGDFFNDYIRRHPDLDITDVIKRSNIDRGYAYQILNGRKSHPGKYKLVILCICLGMKLKDIQRALTISDNAILYPKITLDAALIVCINNNYRSALEVEEFLSENGLSLI